MSSVDSEQTIIFTSNVGEPILGFKRLEKHSSASKAFWTSP